MWERARAEDVRRRAAAHGEGLPSSCSILGCGAPTMRAEGKGLAAFYCKRHIEHRARHGSLWHPTYRAADLKPYRHAASKWIKSHKEEPTVASALNSLSTLLTFSGPAEIATRLRGLSPKERAQVAIARLGQAEIDPAKLLEIHLAVAALIEEDPGSHRTREFNLVQAAKVVHRLASGYHRRWEMPTHDGRTVPFEIHAYPRSSGRVLRYLGETIERHCEHVTSKHLESVLALKVSLHGPHPALPKRIGAS